MTLENRRAGDRVDVVAPTRNGEIADVAALREKVAFLSTPSVYDDVVTVEAQETHMSWVFLADRDVYKLKKPVRHPFLDFSTLEARETYCRDEVRLNRRLAPGVYLGVRALTRDAQGALAIDGEGEVVDWLVHMRRLPAERMLDAIITRGALTDEAIDAIGALLGDFYAALPPADIAPEAYVDRFRTQHAQNLEVLEQRAFAVNGARLDRVASAIERVMERDVDLLAARVREKRVVEGHGDLRPEHVCLSDPPVVIDCLEFNRRLRLVDPFDEIAYLGLECERLGAPGVGPRLRRMLEVRLEDRSDDRLFDFYTAFRASLRARLALAHLLEPQPRTPERWAPLASAYFDIAAAAAARLGAPEA